MKRLLSAGIFVVLFSVSLLAASNSQTVVLHSGMQVGDKQLAAGEYKATWTGTGSDVQLSLSRPGKKQAEVTVPAQLVEEKHQNDGVSVEKVNGTVILKEIQLSKVKLVVKNGQTAPAPSTGN